MEDVLVGGKYSFASSHPSMTYNHHILEKEATVKLLFGITVLRVSYKFTNCGLTPQMQSHESSRTCIFSLARTPSLK